MLSLTGKRALALFLVTGALALAPADAMAQSIPWIVLPLAASPIVALLLAVVLGIVTKSWLAGLGNTALVVVWVLWFAAASNYSTSDLLTWAPVVAMGLHSLAMAWIIVLRSRRKEVG